MDTEARMLDAPCLNLQIRVDNSEWLAENVKGIDQSVKDMLQLVEKDEDSLIDNMDCNNNKENHPNKKTELTALIKEISRRHHLLADHYNKTMGELSSQSKSAKHNENKTFDPQLTPPFLTPMNKLRMHELDVQIAASDLSLSSGGGISDVTPNEGSESSQSSDSDLETYYASPNTHSSSVPTRDMLKDEVVNLRTDYEKKLGMLNEKLLSAEEEITKLKREVEKNESVVVKLGGLEAELLSAKNQIKLQESEIEKENNRSLVLQRKIVDLECELELEKKNAYRLQENVEKFTVELSHRDVQIRELNIELQDASGNFALEKWQLESLVSTLSERLNFHEAKTEELQMQREMLANENSKFQAEKSELEKTQEALRITWRDDIEHAKTELSQKAAIVDALNKNLDGLKHKYDIATVEKDEVNAKLQTLVAKTSCWENHIERLEHNLHGLEIENKRLSSEVDSANILMNELKSKVNESEKEVQMQAIMISNLAEEKKEAIRQLCLSIDHFRCLYEELRSACVVRRRPGSLVR